MVRWSLVGCAITATIALVSAAQQWAELRGGEKQLSFLASLLFQGGSWIMLAVLIPVLGWLLSRYPLDRSKPSIAAYTCGSLLFASVFLGASLPIRSMFHPAPVLWNGFGDPFYKSGWYWIALAFAIYWIIVIGWSYLHVRSRAAQLEDAVRAPFDGTPEVSRITLRGASGDLVVDPSSIMFAETSGRASVVLINGERRRLRDPISELESRWRRSDSCACTGRSS